MQNGALKEFIENAGIYGGFGAFGGLALYLNMVRKGVKFSFIMLLINLLLSAWIGIIMFSFLPETMGNMKIGLISISGFLSYPILNFLEENGLDIFIKRFLSGGVQNKKK